MNEKCRYINVNNRLDVLHQFLTQLQPVWVWDLREDTYPILVNSSRKIESILEKISFHIGVLAFSEINNQALYLNSDAETYLCGAWEYNPKKY